MTESRASAWALLGRVLRRQRRPLLRAAAGGAIWQSAGLLVPIVMGRTVDAGIVDGDRSAIWLGGAALVLLGSVEVAAATWRHRMACTAYMGSTADLRSQLTAAALGLDAEARSRFPPGEVLARETSDADTIGGLVDGAGFTVAQVLSVPVILVVLFTIDPLVAGAVAAIVPITAVLVWRSGVVWERRSELAQAAMGRAIEGAQETVEGFKVLRGLGVEAASVRRFALRSALLRDRSTDVGRLWLAYEPMLEVLSVVSASAVLLIGGNRVIDGAIPLGEAVTAIGLVLFLAQPVRTIGERLLELQAAFASAKRIVEVLDASTRLEVDAPDPMASQHRVPLELIGVAIPHPGATGSLAEGVDLALGPGDLVVLDGTTGSGKTTLLTTMAGLRAPAAGTVALGGLPLPEWPLAALRRRVVLCGPSPFLFGGTIADNLRFADGAATDHDLRGALTAAACGFVDDLPDGWDAELGERGVSLSGGQRQRLALARAVLARPSVLLIDGATTALDRTTEATVVAGLRASLPDAALVLVSANPAVRALADQVLTIGDGQVTGSPR